MEIAYDLAKDDSNFAKHGLWLDFALRTLADPGRVEWIDDRLDYGETRFTALSSVGERVFVTVYALRGEVYRIISLRKANAREKEQYRAAQG